MPCHVFAARILLSELGRFVLLDHHATVAIVVVLVVLSIYRSGKPFGCGSEGGEIKRYWYQNGTVETWTKTCVAPPV